MLGEDGTVLEKWEGLRLRKVEDIPRRNPWPEALIGHYLERRLEALLPNARVSVAVERGVSVQAVLQRLVGEATILYRADGKPEIARGDAVSAAHAGDLTLAVAGGAPLGCDLEPVSARSLETWRDLLGPDRFRLAELISRQENFNTAATRIWTAIECLKKAGSLSGAPLVCQSEDNDGWLLLRAGTLSIATYAAHVRGGSETMIFGVLAPGPGPLTKSAT